MIIDEIYEVTGGFYPERDVLIGSYETILNALNHFIQVDGYNFKEGELWAPDYDWYDDAYYLEGDEDGLYVGKAFNDFHKKYIMFECDGDVYVEADYLEKYAESNSTSNVIVFSYDDAELEDEDDDEHFNHCLRIDDDKTGFTFCIHEGNESHKFRYRGMKKLTEADAWDIIHKNFS